MSASGAHDLGGQPGFGPIPQDDAVFHEAWEARVFAVAQFAQDIAGFTTDGFRHGIEREDPALYRRLPYWHRWLRNANRMLIEGGVLPDGVQPPTRTTDCTPPSNRGAARTAPAPARFCVGDRVRAATAPVSPGHTRLPAYVMGQTGTIALVNDVWVYPDTNAHGRGENPTWVYAVSFAAADLWPNDVANHSAQNHSAQNHSAQNHSAQNHSAQNHNVVVDLFEPYLELA